MPLIATSDTNLNPHNPTPTSPLVDVADGEIPQDVVTPYRSALVSPLIANATPPFTPHIKKQSASNVRPSKMRSSLIFF